MTERIEDYALIGDCHSAAIVRRDGSIEWLSWPRFDSGAVFAAMLGTRDQGHWSICAKGGVSHIKRRYRPGTLILETEIETADGAFTIVDFMPLTGDGASHIVRYIQGVRGKVDIVSEFIVRFDYGLIVPWVTRIEGGALKAIAGPDMVVLRTPAPMKAEGFKHIAEFTINAGESIPFVMSYGRSFEPVPPPLNPANALEETERAWLKWSANCNLAGKYSHAVLRSLITLKGLTYNPTGGIAAAATTSLPEEIGGVRNWDYRYCWLRDATFTLLAFMNSGFRQEADDWRRWLRRAVAGSPQQVQIVYGLAGERRLPESEIPWLSGFLNSKPVRIGNAAAGQLQLDIFGEVMDALYQGSLGGLDPHESAWPLQFSLIEHLETVWHLPDEGLWEVRGGSRHFTHSKVMAWVAFDRAVKMIETFGVEGPVERWRDLKDRIHRQVCERGYDAEIGSFVQSYGSKQLDASALLIALVGFLPPSDPRIASTVKAVGKRLKIDGLIRRYDTATSVDGVEGGEGAFLACSFWYADNLILLGRHAEAQELFELLLGFCNDVGLLSEEYDPIGRRMLGNFPQAFSHVALINTAQNLYGAGKPAAQRSSCGDLTPRKR